MAHVFISYSRADLAFVRNLKRSLESTDRQVWVDLDNIPASAEWMNEINTAIEAADAVVFVLSPSAVESDICALELSHAVRQNKRLVPILRREISESSNTPGALAKLNWLFFREDDDFDDALSSLTNALDMDLDWVRAHTRLLTRAIEWDATGRQSSVLLRGTELSSAEAMLRQQGDLAPALTELQTRYVADARRAARRRRRWLFSALTVAALMAILAVGVIDNTRQRALEERSQRLAEIVPSEKDLRLLLATEAVTSVAPSPLGAHQNLIDALFEQGLIPRVDVRGRVRQVMFGSDSKSLYVAGTVVAAVRRWDIDSLEPKNPFDFKTLPKPRGRADLAPDAVIAQIFKARANGSIRMTIDAKRIATTAATDRDVSIWEAHPGRKPKPLAKLPVDRHNGTVVAFSLDGRWLVIRGGPNADAPAVIWDIDANPPIPQQLPATSGGGSLIAAFSPNGRRLATAARRGKAVKVWATNSFDADAVPYPEAELPTTPGIDALAFGPQGRWLFAGTELWDLDRAGNEAVTPVKKFRKAHPQRISTATFSADSRYLVTAGIADGRPSKKVNTRLWDLRALDQESLVLPHYDLTDHDETHNVIASAFSPDGQWLATASSRNPSRIYLWPLHINALVAIAQQQLNRNFRDAEWKEEYFRDEAFDPNRPFGAKFRVRD